MRFSWLALLVLTGCPSPFRGGEDSGSVIDLDEDDDGFPVTIDCDDGDATVHPGAAEIWYDGFDQDCSGGSDYDQDGDGVDRDPEGLDCDDQDPDVAGGIDERCDGKDNDCDGVVDADAVDQLPIYVDADGDDWGAGDPVGYACEAEAGYSTSGSDCDDADGQRNPGADERCDGEDDDCDGAVDEDPVDGQTYHPDVDGDGYGNGAVSSEACALVEGWVTDDGDCNDGDPLSYPGAAELCDTFDNDCDAEVDEGSPPDRTWYFDGDGDGYGGDTPTTSACAQPDGYAWLSGDCDDADSTVSPAATEVCDEIDNDCDAVIDSDAAEAVAYHPDADGDGYGDAYTEQRSCDPIADWLTDASDCDDSSADAYPGGTEACDGLDNDCDGTTDPVGSEGATTYWADADGDGYGNPDSTLDACYDPVGYTDNAADCDDTAISAYPGGTELCDGLDNNCDGDIDEGTPVDSPFWYYDGDGDGYGDPATGLRACAAPDASYVDNDADCDDADVYVNPLNPEADNLLDDDCDELVDEDFLAAGDVVVTEVARQPYTGGSGSSLNADAQWFEVYNASSRTIDLSGWRVLDQDGDNFYVSPAEAMVLNAGEYAVFCYAPTWFATPADCDYAWGDIGLGNPYFDSNFYFDRDEDLVSLYVDSMLMDEVHWTYDATNGYWPRTGHYSMELGAAAGFDATLNDDEAYWCVASSADVWSNSAYTGHPDYGTPGEVNGGC